jgi:hypothetical protein
LAAYFNTNPSGRETDFPDEAYQMQEQEYGRQYVKLKLQKIWAENNNIDLRSKYSG